MRTKLRLHSLVSTSHNQSQRPRYHPSHMLFTVYHGNNNALMTPRPMTSYPSSTPFGFLVFRTSSPLHPPSMSFWNQSDCQPSTRLPLCPISQSRIPSIESHHGHTHWLGHHCPQKWWLHPQIWHRTILLQCWWLLRYSAHHHHCKGSEDLILYTGCSKSHNCEISTCDYWWAHH